MANTTVSTTHGFDPNDNRGSLVTILCSTLLPFTTIIVGLRFYCRITAHKLGWDDWVTLLSLVFMLVMSLVELAEVHYGMGRHKVFISPDDYMLYNRAFYVDVIFYNCALASIKLQVLLQYFRLFSAGPRMRRVLIGVTVVICIWGAFTILSAVASCAPVESFWDHSIPGKCFPIVHLAYTHAAGHIVTDLVIFALPIRLLWGLQMPKSQRISLLGIFGLGFFTCCISMIRIGWLNIDRGVDDDSYYNIEAAGWSIGELASAMTVTCLPTLRPLLVKIRGEERGSSGQKAWNSSSVQTIGGSGGKRSTGKDSGRSFGSNKSKGALDSILELTRNDDIEAGLGSLSGSLDKPRTVSTFSGEESPGPSFPIQYPSVGPGVKGYTKTTVGLASPSSSTACSCPCSCGRRAGDGIHVRTDVIQKTRPR